MKGKGRRKRKGWGYWGLNRVKPKIHWEENVLTEPRTMFSKQIWVNVRHYEPPWKMLANSNCTFESIWWSHCRYLEVQHALHDLMSSTYTKMWTSDKLNFHSKILKSLTYLVNSKTLISWLWGLRRTRPSYWQCQVWRGLASSYLLCSILFLCPHTVRELRQSSGSSKNVILFCHPHDLASSQRPNSLCHHICVYVSICQLWEGGHKDADDNTRITWIISAIW